MKKKKTRKKKEITDAVQNRRSVCHYARKRTVQTSRGLPPHTYHLQNQIMSGISSMLHIYTWKRKGRVRYMSPRIFTLVATMRILYGRFSLSSAYSSTPASDANGSLRESASKTRSFKFDRRARYISKKVCGGFAPTGFRKIIKKSGGKRADVKKTTQKTFLLAEREPMWTKNTCKKTWNRIKNMEYINAYQVYFKHKLWNRGLCRNSLSSLQSTYDAHIHTAASLSLGQL